MRAPHGAATSIALAPFRFDLQLFAQSPSANFTATGVGKESTFGTPVTPTLWISAQEVTPNATNDLLERQSMRNQIGQELPDLATYTATATLTMDSDPDVIGSLFAWAAGTESVAPNSKSTNPQALFSAPVAANVAAGATSITIGTPTVGGPPSSLVGQWIAVGAEWALVSAVTGSSAPYTLTFTNFMQATYPYASQTTGFFTAKTTSATVTTIIAYDHTLTLGIPRPTFSTQFNRKTDCIVLSGCKVSSYQFSLQPKQLVTAQFSLMYMEDSNATPGTPAFSTLRPYRTMDPNNTMTVNGSPASVGVLSASFNVNNALAAGEFVLTGGRFVNSFPEGATKATGSMVVQYTNPQFQQLFWGNASATSPQSAAAQISLAFLVLSPSRINGSLYYQMQVIVPNLVITSASAPARYGGYIRQTVNFNCYESTQGAGDDIQLIVTNKSSVAA